MLDVKIIAVRVGFPLIEKHQNNYAEAPDCTREKKH